MSGHDATHVGLQKHSLGPDYPLALVGIGNGDHVVYQIHNLLTDSVLCLRDIASRPQFVVFSFAARDVCELMEWCTDRGFTTGVSCYGSFVWVPRSEAPVCMAFWPATSHERAA